jgi:hypothetical protein
MLRIHHMKLGLRLYYCLGLAMIFLLTYANSGIPYFQNVYAAHTKAVPGAGRTYTY